MGVSFRIRDFAYPLEIYRLKQRFDRNQWLDYGAVQAYQFSRIREILDHALHHVAYYQKLFSDHGLHLAQIKTPDDLQKIPLLTKDLLRRNYTALAADNARSFKPQKLSTSGTTGSAIEFLADRHSNVLEFVYYWRYWGWFGYRLGDPFAELSAEYFIARDQQHTVPFCHQPLLRRLLLNSVCLAAEHAASYIRALRKYQPRFLKGLASNLYLLALLCRNSAAHRVRFDAIFSQGERLLPHQRQTIEETFSCKVYDSYGHMERTAAISQCPHGNYHVHSDYGLVHLERNDSDIACALSPDQYLAEVIGTSLHNYAMPLIRYATGDLVRVSKNPAYCSCGRSFPTVESIIGRNVDIIVTPDGRAVTAIYLAFDQTPGLLLAQAVQEQVDVLVVRYDCAEYMKENVEQQLINNLRKFTGPQMRLVLVKSSPADFTQEPGGKFKAVISKVDLQHNFAFRS
ncbi:MAG TPA: hypothetical protein PLP17_05635 [Oligoflexia bacterium]|nr:hypothetical protein [Oligoflexia bacterium]